MNHARSLIFAITATALLFASAVGCTSLTAYETYANTGASFHLFIFSWIPIGGISLALDSWVWSRIFPDKTVPA